MAERERRGRAGHRPVWRRSAEAQSWVQSWGINPMSSFPGRYALRDLSDAVPAEETRVIIARFVILQVVERVALGIVWPTDVDDERQAALPYLEAMREDAPLDYIRLLEVLGAIGTSSQSALAESCIAAAFPAASRGQSYGAYGFYRIGYHFAQTGADYNLAARGASSAADLCHAMGNDRAAQSWIRRCNAMARLCQ